MENNVNYTLVGAFVISLIAAAILSVIWLSSGFSFEKYEFYRIYMKESVSGLSIDAPVEYNGVNVGSVKKIEISKQNSELVDILLRVKDNTPITKATIATLNIKGLTGIGYIVLRDQGEDRSPLVAKRGEEYPVIATGPSLFLRLDTAIKKLMGDFHSLTESVQGLFDKENQQSIKATLLNLQTITDTLAKNNVQLTKILNNTVNASQEFSPLLKSSRTMVDLLQTQTLPAAYQALNNLDSVAQNLNAVSKEIKQNPAVLIRGTQPGTLGPGER